jgi:hypothetical protein
MHPLRIQTRLKDYSVCRWDRCSGCKKPSRFVHRDDPEAWLRGFKSDPGAMRQLRAIAYAHVERVTVARASDDQVCVQLARLFAIGRLRVCGSALETLPQTATQQEVRLPPAKPMAPATAPRRVREPTAAVPPVIESPTFAASLDVLAQAQALRDAAKSGVPFCEECDRSAVAPRAAAGGAR